MRPLIRESCSHELLLIAGTRPEALQLEPLAAAWQGRLAQCWTGQQPDIPIAASSRPWRRLAPLSHPVRRADLVTAIRLIIGSYLRQSSPEVILSGRARLLSPKAAGFLAASAIAAWLPNARQSIRAAV